MWPSGEARVSKTLNDGSNPSMTAATYIVQAIVNPGGISILPFFYSNNKFVHLNSSNINVCELTNYFL